MRCGCATRLNPPVLRHDLYASKLPEMMKFIRQWLGRHHEGEYLKSPTLLPAGAGNPQQVALSQRYEALLVGLHDAYERGLPTGAAQLNSARDAMLGAGGIEGAILAVANAGFLPVFPVFADPRFASIPQP